MKVGEKENQIIKFIKFYIINNLQICYIDNKFLQTDAQTQTDFYNKFALQSIIDKIPGRHHSFTNFMYFLKGDS